MTLNIQEIEERCSKATPGPWDTFAGATVRAIKGDFAVPIFRSDAPIDWHMKKNLTQKVMRKAYADEVNNATFIAHARTDIPALLEDRKRLVEAMEKWRRAAQVITPGGSEFCDPDGVYEFNARFKRDYVKTNCELAKARKTLSALAGETK